jgi:hypothetical protein
MFNLLFIVPSTKSNPVNFLERLDLLLTEGETVQLLAREVGASENRMKMVALREESEEVPRWKGTWWI